MLVVSSSPRAMKVAASPPPIQFKVPSATEQLSVVTELPTPPAPAHLLTHSGHCGSRLSSKKQSLAADLKPGASDEPLQNLKLR